MNFFDVGILEILVILLVAMMIFGPGRIPEMARQLGRGLRAFRKMTTSLTQEFTKALDTEDKSSSSKGKGSGQFGKVLDTLEKGSDEVGKSLGKFLGEVGGNKGDKSPPSGKKSGGGPPSGKKSGEKTGKAPERGRHRVNS